MKRKQTKRLSKRRSRQVKKISTVAETREHIIAALREILLIAPDLMRFCKGYVQDHLREASCPYLLKSCENMIESISSAKKGVANIAKKTKSKLIRLLKKNTSVFKKK